jgi:hypothetical protein
MDGVSSLSSPRKKLPDLTRVVATTSESFEELGLVFLFSSVATTDIIVYTSSAMSSKIFCEFRELWKKPKKEDRDGLNWLPRR